MRRWSGVSSLLDHRLAAGEDPPRVDRLVGRDLASRQLARLLGIERLRRRPAAAKAAVDRVARDPEDPDQQRRGALIARQRAEDREEDLLGHVLGLAGVAQTPQREAIDARESRFRRAARSPAGSRPGCWRRARRRSARPLVGCGTRSPLRQYRSENEPLGGSLARVEAAPPCRCCALESLSLARSPRATRLALRKSGRSPVSSGSKPCASRQASMQTSFQHQ